MSEADHDGSVAAKGDGRETADVSAMETVLACRKRGEAVALVTVIGATGSAPRGMGATMAVRKDGSIVGTVGGGNLELFTIRHALASIEEGVAGLVHISEFANEEDLRKKLELGKVYPFTITFFEPKERRMTLKPAA